ncbi:MAG: HypC/HybG/HupF family hydrogenase formation chaperone [Acidobacteria bacterium]|nr:HypC/HybG/HupF family hydrogenase formation chaperone [Acidobacteriota bacterium]MDW7983119.1 HypC/HybG/HupF family hydrogenase formation chaperone [Acidobacteriota bacterium]
MCLGVPGRVVEVNGLVAVVDFWGTRRKVRLETVDQPVQPGDYVLVHVGFAIRRIPEEEIEETLAFYDFVVRAAAGDLMGGDVQGEIEAARGD